MDIDKLIGLLVSKVGDVLVFVKNLIVTILKKARDVVAGLLDAVSSLLRRFGA